MANLHRLLSFVIVSLLASFPVLAAEPGEIDLAGWIKNESGTYTKAFSDSNGTSRITLNSPPTGLSTTSTAMVQTSKGLQSFDITKTADVDVSRVGKAVRGLAVLGGPVGMAVTAVSLVCELTTICNIDGIWKTSDPMTDDQTATAISNLTATWHLLGTDYPNKTLIQAVQARINPPAGFYLSHLAWVAAPNGGTMTFKVRTSAGGYYMEGVNASINSGAVSIDVTMREASASDWNAKESLLNDSRFVPELNEKGIPLPTTGIPTLNADQKKRLGVDTEPTKDSAGNVTGRQETVTEIEAIDAGTSANPGRVIIKETKTTIKYDNSNTQISSDTTTSYSSQPQTENKPQTFEIKFDEVPPAELPTHNVQATFSSTSWGEGTCPPDIDVALSGVGQTFTIPTEPICSTAEMINPFILLLASIAGIYIVSGVRSTEAK